MKELEISKVDNIWHDTTTQQKNARHLCFSVFPYRIRELTAELAPHDSPIFLSLKIFLLVPRLIPSYLLLNILAILSHKLKLTRFEEKSILMGKNPTFWRESSMLHFLYTHTLWNTIPPIKHIEKA